MEQNKHCNSDNLTEIEQEILEYEAETEAWRREVRQRVEQEKEQEKNALINIGIVFLGVLLLFGGVAITVGKKDPVVRHMGYAPWYCLAGVTYAFMPASSNISSSLIKDIQLMEEAYKRQEAKSGN